MMDKTEPRFRYLIRQLFPELYLYTEMIGAGAILYGSCDRFFDLHPEEPPVALQLGTNCPEEAYQAVLLARQYCAAKNGGVTFTEYNLNAGCPSDRVQNRNIGAILMNDASLVADILAAMHQALRDSAGLYPGQALPGVTLKQRLGIRQKSRGIEMSSKAQLYRFVEKIAPFCGRLIVHARIAILDGLSPKQNREIPELNYPLVLALRNDFVPLPVELNGGLKSSAEVCRFWNEVDGIMLGRISYEDTWELFRIRSTLLAKGYLTVAKGGIIDKTVNKIENKIVNEISAVESRSEMVGRYIKYLEQYPSKQSPAAQIWPLLSLWHGLSEARRWRQTLSPPYPLELRNLPNSEAAIKLAHFAHQMLGELETGE